MKKLVQLISSSLAVALLTGCGLSNYQVVKTQTFGAATASIGKLGEEEFVNIRNGIIEMNKKLAVIDHTKTAKNLTFDKPTYAQPTSIRIAASKALKYYGELLVKLSAEDRNENLQAVSNALLNNVEVALSKEFSSEKKDAINTIIVNLGSFWVEKKKLDALKVIIPAYEDAVNKLADLMSEDFSVENGALGYLKAYQVTAKRLKNISIRLINAGDRYTILERSYIINAYASAEEAIVKSERLSEKAQRVISSLKNANTELVKVIQEEKYATDDIKKYRKQLQELVNMYQVLTH